MNSMWWPVRNTYRSGVRRAMTREPMTPMNMANAVFCATSGMSLAMAVIASFVGTTPSTPNAPVMSAPSGVRAPITATAPMTRMMKPRGALSVPPTTPPSPLPEAPGGPPPLSRPAPGRPPSTHLTRCTCGSTSVDGVSQLRDHLSQIDEVLDRDDPRLDPNQLLGELLGGEDQGGGRGGGSRRPDIRHLQVGLDAELLQR